MTCNNCSTENSDLFQKVRCFSSKEPLTVVKCKKCSLVYLNPRPSKELGLLYFEKAYSNVEGFESHSYYRDHEQIFTRNKKRFELITGLQCPNNKVLDFGAGQGHFVKVALDNQWNAEGVEISEAAIYAAKQNFKITLVNSLENLKTNDFSVITLWDVVEHLKDPKSTLQELSKYLHPKGFFVIETSNIDSLDYLVQKKKWSYWHIDHLYYYSRNTLEYLLKIIGFQILHSTIANKHSPGEQSGLSVLKKYITLINPNNLLFAIKRRLLSFAHKGIEKKSLMIVIGTRISS